MIGGSKERDEKRNQPVVVLLPFETDHSYLFIFGLWKLAAHYDDLNQFFSAFIYSRVSASATLVVEHYPEQMSMRAWQSTLDAAVRVGKLEEPKGQVGEPHIPEVSSLYVDSCGWKDGNGMFLRSAHREFRKSCGLVSIAYVEGLMSWCMLAEVACSEVRSLSFPLVHSGEPCKCSCSPKFLACSCTSLFREVEPLYPLREEFCYLRLGDIKGPLLLYICRGSSVHGVWEPLIGPAPGPDVKVYQEVAVRLNGHAPTPASLLLPGIGSSVLDLLFNYTGADWSCNAGFSSLEAMLCAVRLWKGMQVCRFVCRTWRDTLQPFSSLTKICHHALQIPAEISDDTLKTLKVPTIPEAVEAITMAARLWDASLMIPGSMPFKGKAWPAQISEVQITTRMTESEDHLLQGPSAAALDKHAAAFLKYAKGMLPLPLPWITRPYSNGMKTTGDGRRFVNCGLQKSLYHGKNNKSSRVFVREDAEGSMELLSWDGSTLLPSQSASELLRSQGLRLQSISRRWSTSTRQPRKPTEPCETYMECQETSPCEMCQKDVDGRRRWGYSDLFGGYVLEFMEGQRQIDMEINVKLLGFYATSNDASLVSQLHGLLPRSGFESETDPSSDEDDDEDDDQDVEDEDGEEGEEDGGDSEEAQSEGPARRRLTGKQPPPPEWC